MKEKINTAQLTTGVKNRTMVLLKQYSEDFEKLKEIFNSIEIEIIPTHTNYRTIGKKDCEYQKYQVVIKRSNKSISFDYHGSVADFESYKLYRKNQNDIYGFGFSPIKKTWNKQDYQAHMIYDVMCCIRSEGLIDVSDFENFCNELGYNTDSIKDRDLYFECQKQYRNIHQILSNEELECFPS